MNPPRGVDSISKSQIPVKALKMSGTNYEEWFTLDIPVLHMDRRSSTAASGLWEPDFHRISRSLFGRISRTECLILRLCIYLRVGLSPPPTLVYWTSRCMPPLVLQSPKSIGLRATCTQLNGSLLILDTDHKNSDPCAVRGPRTRMGHIRMYSAREMAHTSSDVPYTVR